MGMVYVNKPCSLCGQPIKEGDTYVACGHFIDDRADPLARWSDSAMHRGCFDGWAHRDEFTRRYRAFRTKLRPGETSDWPESATKVMAGPKPKA